MILSQALQYVLIPMFQVSFERDEGDGLIGGPPSPEQDSNDSVISVFVCKVIDPENPFGTSVSNNPSLLFALFFVLPKYSFAKFQKFFCKLFFCDFRTRCAFCCCSFQLYLLNTLLSIYMMPLTSKCFVHFLKLVLRLSNLRCSLKNSP